MRFFKIGPFLLVMTIVTSCHTQPNDSTAVPNSVSSQGWNDSGVSAKKGSAQINVSKMLPEDAMAAALTACNPLLGSMPKGEQPQYYQFTPEQTEKFLERLEAAGAPVMAQDENLREYTQIVEFVKGVQNGENIQTGVFTVSGSGITLLTLAQNNGRQMVCTTTSYFPCTEIITGKLEETTGITLTENGYLLYGEPGEQKVSGKGFRVMPLDESNRIAYSNYVKPLLTGRCNLTTVDWSETDSTALDLSSLFESFYQMDSGKPLSEAGYPLNSQVFTYAIPASDVERIMMKYLAVTESQLRACVGYDSTAGLYHWGSSEQGGGINQAEVIAIWENADGTKTMTVNRTDLMAGKDNDGGFLLTIRVNQNGTFQYVSNRVVLPLET